ncbi:MAG: hypothetical protein SO159_03965 [Dialister sp.]|nr:hypothetical protein [Dialister sp.]MDY3744417.1 hypothetical protein [Dialister sp.]MDY4795138.1 hypothetical protein [Dialister sp.]MDY6114724.1 hypothetical protein [Dialister sp.]
MGPRRRCRLSYVMDMRDLLPTEGHSSGHASHRLRGYDHLCYNKTS